MELYQNNIGDILQRKLEARKSINSSYSLRAFARDLQLGPGTVSSIINGKRKISETLASELGEKLKLSKEELQFVLEPFAIQKEFNLKKEYYDLTESEYDVVSSWICYAILSLINCSDFNSSTADISQRLSVCEDQVQLSLNSLLKVGLIEIDSEGLITRNEKRVTSTNNIPSHQLRDSHKRNLELAKNKIDDISINDRHFQSITMAIDPDKIPQAKELIDNFLDGLSSLVESGNQREVYRFSCQLFPLSELNHRGLIQ